MAVKKIPAADKNKRKSQTSRDAVHRIHTNTGNIKYKHLKQQSGADDIRESCHHVRKKVHECITQNQQ